MRLGPRCQMAPLHRVGKVHGSARHVIGCAGDFACDADAWADRATNKGRPGEKPDQKILTALSSVFQTPQSRGTPTKAQNNAALASSPPNPIP